MERTLTDEEKREYDHLTKDAEQIRMNVEELMNKSASIGGYTMSIETR